ncbi:MAG: 1-acyl-sn-glycerol-3-phosphate acyltransferase [Chlamydiales bacterium]|nr:1-acyl-sn-glycerol-3-phosphate acyltransferase [Chlamydiales bacterium]
MTFLNKLKQARKEGVIDQKNYDIIASLYESYSQSVTSSELDMAAYEPVFDSLLKLVCEQIANPYRFEPYHIRITEPYNYYLFGMDFLRPLVDKARSRVYNIENVKKMTEQLQVGDNIILFANHQTEVDPQLMSLALEDTYPEFAAEVIFVAGDRVISDPMAIPFSMGRNLLCIYSKRHIDTPPEKKVEKQHHNQRTMKRLKELLSEGGKCIYVAPSGGRDRPNASGEVVVSPFDPQSIEMFRLIGKQSRRPAHFYPLALATFDILPPPQTIEKELGEERRTKRDGIFFCFGDEIDLDQFPGSDMQDRHAKRSARAMHIWNLVKTDYAMLKQGFL